MAGFPLFLRESVSGSVSRPGGPVSSADTETVSEEPRPQYREADTRSVRGADSVRAVDLVAFERGRSLPLLRPPLLRGDDRRRISDAGESENDERETDDGNDHGSTPSRADTAVTTPLILR